MVAPPPGCGKESGKDRRAPSIGEELQIHLRRAAAGVDQHESGLPAVAGGDVRDGAAAGSDVGQSRNGGERIARSRTAWCGYPAR